MSHKKAQKEKVLSIWLGCTVVVLAILSLILIAPLTAGSQPQFARSIYGGFALLCHQLPERSYFIAGHKFAVCARCTGLYAGFAFTFLLYPLLRPLRAIDWPPPVWLVLAAVPMAIDFGLTFFGIWENTHLTRFVTGMILGVACATFILPALVDVVRNLSRIPPKVG